MIMKATPNTRPRILFVTTADGLKSEDRLSIFHTNRDTTPLPRLTVCLKHVDNGDRECQTQTDTVFVTLRTTLAK